VTPAGCAPDHELRSANGGWSCCIVFWHFNFNFTIFTSDITRGVSMAVCSTVVALFTTLAIPLAQTTAVGQSIRAWAVSFSPNPPPVRIRAQRSNGQVHPRCPTDTAAPAVPIFSRHISVISPLSCDRWPALITSKIPMRKSSSRLSKPNCPLSNTLKRRQTRLIPRPTCGDFCFHAARGSSSSTSGGYSRPTPLAVVTITRFVYPE